MKALDYAGKGSSAPHAPRDNRIYLLALGLSLGLVVLGHLSILQRSAGAGSPYLSLGGDSLEYLKMTRGESHAKAPFKYRLLAPTLARALPFSAAQSLRLITYFGLGLTYFLLILLCLRLGLQLGPTLLALGIYYASSWHLYHYYNPFLTDTLALAMLTLMLYAYVSDSFRLFVLALVVGVLTRETCIFLAPLWLLKDRKRGCLLLAAGLALLFAPRLLPPAELNGAIQGSWAARLQSIVARPHHYLKDAILAWGSLWLFGLTGLLLLRKRLLASVGVACGLLLGGAWLTSLIAYDVGRMFAVLTPVAVVLCAQVLARLLERGYGQLLLLVLAVHVQAALLSTPNLLFGEGVVLGAIYTKLLLLTLNGLSALYLAALSRREIALVQSQHLDQLKQWLQARSTPAQAEGSEPLGLRGRRDQALHHTKG